jgi:hypothetical protein
VALLWTGFPRASSITALLRSSSSPMRCP